MNGGTCEVYRKWFFLLREIENLSALCVPNFVASNGSYVLGCQFVVFEVMAMACGVL
jgi:hypothetical protein